MKLFLLLFIVNVAILTKADKNNNINRATPITCEQNSFNIEVPFPAIVDNLEVTIYYQLKPQQNLNVPNNNFPEYARACLNNLVFMITPENRPTYIERKKLTDDSLLNGLIAQFKDLQPLTRYQFKIGYEQNNPYPQTVYIKDLQAETCFGEPGVPENLRKNLNSDESVTVVWDPPSVINAPSICYYLVVKRTGNGNTVNKYEQTGLSFNVTKNEIIARTFLEISTYNDARCYLHMYPFASKCRITSSNYIVVRFDSSILPTTTKQVVSSARSTRALNGYHFFCFVLAFFYRFSEFKIQLLLS